MKKQTKNLIITIIVIGILEFFIICSAIGFGYMALQKSISIFLLTLLGFIILATIFVLVPIWSFRRQYKVDIKNKIKIGKEGERIVQKILGETQKGKQYVINKLIIGNEEKSTQIDHIYINKNGIWCIETKYWKGTIYGNRNSEEWTQRKYVASVPQTRQNPIKQNEYHVNKIKEILPEAIIHNIVVMLYSNITELNEDTQENVCTENDLRIRLWNESEMNISENEMQNYYETLMEIKANQITEKQHLKNILKSKQYEEAPE